MVQFSRQELEEALSNVSDDHFSWNGKTTELAAEAYLATMPMTEEIDVWHIEFVSSYDDYPCVRAYRTESEAVRAVLTYRAAHDLVRITGPHKHLVPA